MGKFEELYKIIHENIKENTDYTYRELCSATGMEIKNGNSKTSQLKKTQRNCRL